MTVFFVGATQFLFTGFLHFRRFFPSIFNECMCALRNRRNDLWFRQNKIKIQATIPWHSIDFRASTRHKTKVNPFNGCRYIAPTVTKKALNIWSIFREFFTFDKLTMAHILLLLCVSVCGRYACNVVPGRMLILH